ncbi:MAG: hypothetical protein OQL19_05965 [Gammaproteobacteria bacterium]|nr:hypothetical protein [Gammaproteobacteria bacterium]
MVIHKHLRIFILLLILLVVAVGNLATQWRATDWDHSLRVVVYPINGDHRLETDEYIQNLSEEAFDDIKPFFIEELENYGISLSDPVDIALSDPVKEHPPMTPRQGNIFEIILWSLKLRYWAFQRDEYQGPKPEIQVFALYFDPQKSQSLRHSTGLEKGHIAVINLFANKKQNNSNQFIIAHELLHTLGASDKYHFTNNEPIYPHGYAEPELEPLYPQSYAEIMGGRIPISQNESRIPKSLSEVIIGEQTAREIRLLK